MPSSSKKYPKSTFDFGDDGLPTVNIGQTL